MFNTAINRIEYPKIIHIVKGEEKEIKYTKDGKVKQTKCHKTSGKSSEVYAFKSEEEIKSVIGIFDKHIAEATNNHQRQIAYRNKLLFIIGINIGIRASDLRTLQWNFFFDKQDDGTLKFKNFYVLQPMKQKKQKKFVKLFFNQTVQKIIEAYVNEYPIRDLNDYLFFSREGNDAITVQTLWKIIKDIASEAGIEQNIGSHSLRKTFGYWCWHQADDKDKALVILQQIFNHSSTQITLKYIGVLDNEIEDMFDSLELGLNMI
jgi:integrase